MAQKNLEERNAAHLVVDQSRQGEIVEQVGEEFPYIGIPVLSQALVVESVHLGDLPRLVVASQDGHPVPVSQFQRDEERDRLDRVVTPVHVVAHEEVVCVWRITPNAEELGQVVLDGQRCEGLDGGGS